MPYAKLRSKPACLAALLLSVTLPLTSCDPGSTLQNTFVADEQFSYTFDVVDQVRLTLESVNGTIRVTGVVDATSVTVQGTKLVWSNSQADADAGLDTLDVVIEEEPDEFIVYTDQPDTGTRSYAVEYEIRLPDDLAVGLLNVNGDIIVEFVRASVEIASVNANINLDEVEGNVSAELVNGNVDAELTLPLGGVVEMAVANGNITIEIPTNTSADVFFEGCCNWAYDNLDLQNVEESGPGVWPPTLTGTLGAGQGTISLLIGNGVIWLIGV